MYIYILPVFLCALHPSLLSIFRPGVMALVGDAIATNSVPGGYIYIYIYVYIYKHVHI